MKPVENIFDYLGGRKFILSLILIIVGAVIELKTDRGVSTAFAGLLVGILTAFSASNAFTTTKMGAGADDSIPQSNVPVPDPKSLQAIEDVQKAIKEINGQLESAGQTLVTMATAVSNQNKIISATMQK